MKLCPAADHILAHFLGDVREADAMSVADFNRCASVVDGLCRSGMYEHAEQHAAAVRFNLGAPWDGLRKQTRGGAA